MLSTYNIWHFSTHELHQNFANTVRDAKLRRYRAIRVCDVVCALSAAVWGEMPTISNAQHRFSVVASLNRTLAVYTASRSKAQQPRNAQRQWNTVVVVQHHHHDHRITLIAIEVAIIALTPMLNISYIDTKLILFIIVGDEAFFVLFCINR